MIDNLSAIAGSIGAAITLAVIAWLTIMLPTTIALAGRKGLGVGFGVACAFLPFVGWGVIFYISRGRTHPSGISRRPPDALDNVDHFDY